MADRLTAAQFRELPASKKQRQPEAAIVRQVRDLLRLRGWYVIRIQQGLGSHRGLSDLICVKDGRTVFIECKTATGRLSQDQRDFQAAMATAGGEYLIARSSEDVMDL